VRLKGGDGRIAPLFDMQADQLGFVPPVHFGILPPEHQLRVVHDLQHLDTLPLGDGLNPVEKFPLATEAPLQFDKQDAHLLGRAAVVQGMQAQRHGQGDGAVTKPLLQMVTHLRDLAELVEKLRIGREPDRFHQTDPFVCIRRRPGKQIQGPCHLHHIQLPQGGVIRYRDQGALCKGRFGWKDPHRYFRPL
jgi:hypothetical protein